jgi:glycosyltransferase involved in cell wall biosynthesis
MTRLKKLSILIPCYNEDRSILAILKKIKKADTLGLAKEIIIIDDGSNQKTKTILKKVPPAKNLKIFTNQTNRGKGYSIQKGIQKSTGDVILIQDADLEYSPQDYPLLLGPLLENKADVVYGSRLTGHLPRRVLYFHHYLANRFLTFVSNLFTNLNLTDMETGYKVFLTSKIKGVKLRSFRFGLEPEITAKLARLPNIRFYEVGISYTGRTYQEGKHITSLDALKTIFQIIYYHFFD